MTTMTSNETGTRWTRRGCAYVSLAISLAEILIIGGALVLVYTSKQPPTPLIVRLVGDTWLAGSFGSLGFAVAALIFDADSGMAVAAMLLASVTFFICGFPMLSD